MKEDVKTWSASLERRNNTASALLLVPSRLAHCPEAPEHLEPGTPCSSDSSDTERWLCSGHFTCIGSTLTAVLRGTHFCLYTGGNLDTEVFATQMVLEQELKS